MELVALAVCWHPLGPRENPRKVLVYNMWDQQVPYSTALSWQRKLHAERVEAAFKSTMRQPDDAVLVLQHPPVLTLGTSSSLDNVKDENPPFDVFRCERGGEVTYHGPGQLVVYPVLDLRAYRQVRMAQS